MLRYSKKNVWGARTMEWLLWPLSRLQRRRSLAELPEAPVIALLEPFQMGDVLSLAVMIDPILRRYPAARIVVWCHAKNAQVFARDARVWKVVTARFPWSNRDSKRGSRAEWTSVLASCRTLRRLRVDVGVDPRGDVRSQALMVLGSCANRIGYRRYVGSNMRLRGLLLTHAVEESGARHRYEVNLCCLEALLGERPGLDLPAYNADGVRREDSGAERLVLIHPGGGWAYRRWPVERWVALIERLQALPGLRVVQIAGPGEAELAAEVNAGLACPVETRQTGFDEMLALMERAELMIGLDSGPMHAVVLMDRPVVALFGPGQPGMWRPLSAGSEFLQHVEAYPCHPCTQRQCVRPERPCMQTIPVEEVFAATRRALAARARQGTEPTLASY